MTALQRIQELRDSKPNINIVDRLKRIEGRIRFHTKPHLNRKEAGRNGTRFLQWVRSILTPDKYSLFLLCYKHPIPTVKLMGEVFSRLKKIFDGGNPFTIIETTDSDVEKAIREMCKNDRAYWSTVGYMAMMQNPNSMVVVDRAVDGGDPYHYILTLDRIEAFTHDKGDIESVCFSDGEHEKIYIDKERYVRYEERNSVITILSENPHSLGRCPVTWFWSDLASVDDPCMRKSVLMEHLGELDHLLMFIISERCSDLYAVFPMYWSIVDECNYEDDNYSCDGGALINRETEQYAFDSDGESLRMCPKCASKMIGVGTTLDVTLPLNKDQPYALPPAGQIGSDVEILKHIVDKRESRIAAITESITGHKIDVQGSKAINTEQVQSIIEGAKSRLMSLKVNFERIEEWTILTKAQLKHGTTAVSSVRVNYGTEFYLLSASQLQELYAKAKSEIDDSMLLDSIQLQLYETRYKDNPELLTRVKLLMDLDPMRHATKEETVKAYELGLISKEELYLKYNFSTLISRFEATNSKIQNFGLNLPYSKKIANIKQELLSYGTNIKGDERES